MTFEEWRQTRKWYDTLPGKSSPGFVYDDGSHITNYGSAWDGNSPVGNFGKLKDDEYMIWCDQAKFNYDIQEDECTIVWSEIATYSCTAPLTRGLDDVDAFDAMQKLITLNNDVEEEEINVSEPIIEEITWE